MSKTKFTDKNGDVWKVHITLSDARRLATTVGIDVLNFSDYDKLSQSIGVRLEYIYHLCRERCADLDVNSLDEFATLLMSDETTANKASDALQEAIISFYRRLGQTGEATLAEEHLKFMQATRTQLAKPEVTEQLKKAGSVGRKSLQLPRSRESTGDP